MENWLGIKCGNNTLVFNNSNFMAAIHSVIKNKNKIRFMSYSFDVIKPLKIKFSTNFRSKKYKKDIVSIRRFYLFLRNGEYYICANPSVLKRDDILIASNCYSVVKSVKSQNNAFWILKTFESSRYFVFSTGQHNTPLRSDLHDVENTAEKMAIFDDLMFNFNKLNKNEKEEFLQKIVKIEITKTIL